MATPEQEAIVRAVMRTCQGPPRIPAEVQEAFFARLAAGEDAQTLQGEFLRLAVKEGYVFILRDTVRDTLIASLRQRAGCGFDFNEIVLAGPLDGKERAYKCPRCGVTGTYRAPFFPP